MKKTLTALTSLAIMIGLVGSAQASTAARTPGRTTHAPPAARAPRDGKLLSILNSSKRLSAQQLRALGLKPLFRHQQVAELKRLQAARKSMGKGKARAATVGGTYAFTFQNAGNSWVDVYDDFYFVSSNEYYYYIYDNFKTCDVNGFSCIDANAFTYYLWVYYFGTWYYTPTAYLGDGQGYGPYFG